MPSRTHGVETRAVSRVLLNWFRKNARRLPWRETRSAYRIWVSEVMLQQTQVAAVIPYYRRFLRAFPAPKTLCEAPVEKVMEIWSGLGYYRRARNLQAAACEVVRRFSGRFPADYGAARSLPGVGDYTARAVLSIAYNLPYAVLDGNVARVLARLKGYRGNLHEKNFRAAVERDLEALLPTRAPGDFNQALMELGQTVCLPRAPRCADCPLRKFCRAAQSGTPESYPDPRPRRPAQTHYLAAGLLRRGNRVAMVRGLDQNLLADLWNFPSAFGRSQDDALRSLQRKLGKIIQGEIRYGKAVCRLRHSITFRAIQIQVYPVAIKGGPVKGTLRWFPLSLLPGAAVSQLTRKITARL